MSQVFNVRRADGFDFGSQADLYSVLRKLPVGHTATVTISGRSNNDLSSTASVSHVPDGWVVFCPADVEPIWVSSLREFLSSGKDPVDSIDF